MSDDDIRQLQEYYERRAPEYEAMYDFDDPERRKELDTIESLARTAFKNKTVLEIACGSGYWTELLSGVATSVTAVDTSEPMLEIARSREYPNKNVRFELADAYNLDAVPGDFDASLAGFWLSHVPLRRRRDFLSGLQSRLKPSAPVLFFDNNLVEGLGGELIEDTVKGSDSGDTFKQRTVADGSTHLVLKNYFTTEDLRALFRPYASEIELTMGHWYWSALYRRK